MENSDIGIGSKYMKESRKVPGGEENKQGQLEVTSQADSQL